MGSTENYQWPWDLVQRNPDCGCHTCNPKAWWMVCCATCGNKRCPRAMLHSNVCTGSNESGQPGSAYADFSPRGTA